MDVMFNCAEITHDIVVNVDEEAFTPSPPSPKTPSRPPK